MGPSTRSLVLVAASLVSLVGRAEAGPPGEPPASRRGLPGPEEVIASECRPLGRGGPPPARRPHLRLLRRPAPAPALRGRRLPALPHRPQRPGSPVKARLVSNGSAINALARQPNWKNEAGIPVHVRVGRDREPFGADLARLDGPRYADGLPADRPAPLHARRRGLRPGGVRRRGRTARRRRHGRGPLRFPRPGPRPDRPALRVRQRAADRPRRDDPRPGRQGPGRVRRQLGLGPVPQPADQQGRARPRGMRHRSSPVRSTPPPPRRRGWTSTAGSATCASAAGATCWPPARASTSPSRTSTTPGVR